MVLPWTDLKAVIMSVMISMLPTQFTAWNSLSNHHWKLSLEDHLYLILATTSVLLLTPHIFPSEIQPIFECKNWSTFSTAVERIYNIQQQATPIDTVVRILTIIDGMICMKLDRDAACAHLLTLQLSKNEKKVCEGNCIIHQQAPTRVFGWRYQWRWTLLKICWPVSLWLVRRPKSRHLPALDQRINTRRQTVWQHATWHYLGPQVVEKFRIRWGQTCNKMKRSSSGDSRFDQGGDFLQERFEWAADGWCPWHTHCWPNHSVLRSCLACHCYLCDTPTRRDQGARLDTVCVSSGTPDAIAKNRAPTLKASQFQQIILSFPKQTYLMYSHDSI